MSASRLLRLRLHERLEAAVEEIFGLVEKTIAEYEEDAVRSKREIGQLKQQLEQLVVSKPGVALNRAASLSEEEEIPPDWPPDVEGHETRGSRWVKEEPVDAEVEASNEAEAGRPGSDPPPPSPPPPPPPPPPREQVDQCVIPDFEQDLRAKLPAAGAPTDFQLFPTSGIITVTLREDADEDAASSSRAHALALALAHRDADARGPACHLCGGRFRGDAELIAHVDQVHNSARAFKCPECDKRFACRAHLVAHLRIHTGEKPYRCSFCARSFAQSSNLNVHLRTHTGEKPYFCRACGKMVARSNHLKRCGRTDLEARRRSFGCSACGKTFRAAAKLRAHERIHEAGT